MDGSPDLAPQYCQFVDELHGTEWHASVRAAAGGVCLRIERYDTKAEQHAAPAIEFCRRTLAEAVDRARRHIFS